MTLELHSNTTAQHLLMIEGFTDLLNELRENILYTTPKTALQLNNWFNNSVEQIDGSIRLNDDILVYFGYDSVEANNGVYDYIIKQNDAEKDITTFSIHNRGSFMYKRLLTRAF